MYGVNAKEFRVVFQKADVLRQILVPDVNPRVPALVGERSEFEYQEREGEHSGGR
jgi:hypothetical protein